MAHYRASESKREQFRRYLEKAGVLDSLTNVLVALYEETEKPSNALDFIKQHLSTGDLDSSKVNVIRVELEELQQKYDQLQAENRELRNRLSEADLYNNILEEDPSGRRLRSLQARTSRPMDSFIHQAVRKPAAV